MTGMNHRTDLHNIANAEVTLDHKSVHSMAMGSVIAELFISPLLSTIIPVC